VSGGEVRSQHLTADELLAMRDGEHVWVALKRMCEALGLDAASQARRLKGQPWATTVTTTAVAEDGKTRELFCLDIECVPMWLATIQADRVRPETRAKLALVASEAEVHRGGVAR